MIQQESLFNLLQDWYLAQCNGDWEHEFGIKIDTLDNPGWSVVIDLLGTKYENKKFNELNYERNSNDWIQCSVINDQFKAAGGPRNLKEIVTIFIEWINKNELNKEKRRPD